MNRFTFLLFSLACLILSYNSYSQKSYGGFPVSYSDQKLSSDIDHVILMPPDLDRIMLEDTERNKNGEMHRIGVVIPVSINMDNSGTWEVLDDGTEIWRLKITCPGAISLTTLYNSFYLPEGSKLFLYNENRRHLLGEFNHNTNPLFSKEFSTEMVEGETTYYEYIKPAGVTEEAVLNIEALVYNYRDVQQFVGYYSSAKAPDFGASESCNVNIKCPEGNNWQVQKRGIALMYTIEGSYAGYCTGTLVNNTSNDGTPYLLSADHCGGEAVSDMGFWQFYFNFESANCTNPTSAPTYDVINGATFKSRGPNGAGGTDFLLLQLSTTQQDLAAINAYYNGWDKSPTPSSGGVSIHHPSGDIKKISTFSTTATDGTFNACIPGGHWKVDWVATATDHGITEPGSSGSPLFNGANKLVIGTLSGGNSSCTASASDKNDLYGKFHISWEDNGTAANRRLKPWLDPTNSGNNTCPGFDPSGTTPTGPVADFSASSTTVFVNEIVTFTDLSTNNPTTRSWTFQNGTPATSTVASPTVRWTTPGTYDVSLTVTNSGGSDTKQTSDYITVLAAGALGADFTSNTTSVQEGGTVTFQDLSIGNPTTWNWTFEGGIPATSPDRNPTVTYATTGTYSVTLRVGNGTTNDEKVRPGYITVTQGSGGTLVADFIATPTQIMMGQCVSFQDRSIGDPIQWNWTFPGSTTPSSGLQNPNMICYENEGVFDVILQVRKGALSNTYVCRQCITVSLDPELPLPDFEGTPRVVPVGGVVNFTNLSENGPFSQWEWTFEGGTPASFNDSAPPPIAYHQPGLYSVTLRTEKADTYRQHIKFKEDYIRVVAPATEAPIADFAANNTVIRPGDAINFIDFSSGTPYEWEWTFTGGTPATSNLQYPRNIVYNAAGVYPVTLRVSNNISADTLTKELYIVVSNQDDCTEAPVAAFSANNRLIAQGGKVYFQNLSTGNPTFTEWKFERGGGALPVYSYESSPTFPIQYDYPGIHKVTLTVSNNCGSDVSVKDKYIYVFSGPVSEYCETLSSTNPGDILEAKENTEGRNPYGYIAGHNNLKIRNVANYFDRYTFNQVKGVTLSVADVSFINQNSYLDICIWEPEGNRPAVDPLVRKRVYLRDITVNQGNYVAFDQPVSIDGPFYAGFRINYQDTNNDGESDDIVGCYIVTNRGNDTTENTLFFYHPTQRVWRSTNELFGFSSSLLIKPSSCLIDVEDYTFEDNIEVYPNPTTGNVNIKLTDESIRKFSIEVFDALGRKIYADYSGYDQNEYTVNLGGHPEGLYILKITSGKTIVNKKILLTK